MKILSLKLRSHFLVSLFMMVTLFSFPIYRPFFMPETALTPPKTIPHEVLFGNPEKAKPRISPDGTKIAYLRPVNNVLNIWIKTIGQEDDQPLTQDTNRGIRRYFWAQDGEHLLYLQDRGGNENWRLFGVSLVTGKTRDLTPFENVKVRVMDVHKDFPDQILISMNKENPKLHDIYRLWLKSGRMELEAKNPGNVARWMTDAHFNVRGCLVTNQEGGYDFLIRHTKESEWIQLMEWDLENAHTTRPISFSEKGDTIYLRDSRNFNTSRLVELEIATGRINTVIEDSEYDVGAVMIHPDTYQVQLVAVNKAKPEWTVLDDSIREDVKAIQALHPGKFLITSRSNKDDIWTVGFISDNGPTPYYAYFRDRGEFVFLFDNRPDLKKYKLAAMEPIQFTSRDGLQIEGYITFPVGRDRKNLPMVLNVHGGPWRRDSWGYDSEAQWLANRGYICLQINFRGSKGFGKDFLNAGNKEWGGKMHNDLVDAVGWAVNKGYADPDRVAIYGASYGGYAALVGATFTPDLFRCAVDIVGPSNLISFMKTVPPYWKLFLPRIYKKIGNPNTEAEFLKSRSPLFKADQIKIPILIAQGANDPRVKKEESEQIVEVMKKKGLDYEYLLFPDEGHGFAKPKNRLKFYETTEKFLAKHLREHSN